MVYLRASSLVCLLVAVVVVAAAVVVVIAALSSKGKSERGLAGSSQSQIPADDADEREAV